MVDRMRMFLSKQDKEALGKKGPTEVCRDVILDLEEMVGNISPGGDVFDWLQSRAQELVSEASSGHGAQAAGYVDAASAHATLPMQLQPPLQSMQMLQLQVAPGFAR